MTNARTLRRSSNLPVLIADAGKRDSLRFLEFFATATRNSHTRRAYGHAAAQFLTWCDEQGVRRFPPCSRFTLPLGLSSRRRSAQLRPRSFASPHRRS
jgi:hypothetical protein